MDKYVVSICILSINVILCISYTSPFLFGSSTRDVTHQSTTPTGAINVCQLPDNQRITIAGGCNFNNGTCGYEFPAELWSLHSESAGQIMFGKIDDDSTNGIQQDYALFLTYEGKIPENTSSVIITTPVANNDICLTFWYLMPNQNSQLKIFITDENTQTSTLVWEVYHQRMQTWQKVEIPIHRHTPFVVSFKSTKENNFGYVGLDSVMFDIEKLPTTTSTTTTTIESTTSTSVTTTKSLISTAYSASTSLLNILNGTLTFTTMTGTQFNATPSPTSKRPGTANSTMQTVTGVLLNATTSPTSKRSGTPTSGMLTSSIVNKTSSHDNITTAVPTGQSTICNCKCPTPTIAQNCQTTTPLTNVQTQTGMLLMHQSCSVNPNKAYALNGSCDFNKDICGYSVPLYPHLWELTSYRYTYGSPGVGEIIGDHSKDSSGGYMVFNTNNKHVQNGASGEITSLPMFTNGSACLEFWYNMPSSIAMLEVYVVRNESTRQLIWRGNGGTSGWTQANVQIHVSGRFKVSFISQKTTKEGFVGLDDISISAGSKAPTTQQPTSQMIMSPDNTCSCVCPTAQTSPNCTSHKNQEKFHPICRNKNIMMNASCDFETGPCTFQIPMYPHLWEITRYNYGSKPSGTIDGDHTSGDGSGNYAVFSTNNLHVQLGAHGEMTSLPITANGTICVTFWYNMPTNKATLTVYKRYPRNVFPDEVLWKQGQMETKGWHEVSVVMHSNNTFKIVFSATKLSLDGYVGIDDVAVRYG